MIPWGAKGTARHYAGLAAHFLGGVLICGMVYGVADSSFSGVHALLVGLLASAAGILWELGGWHLRRWPPNAADILPWTIGGLTSALIVLLALGD